MFTLPIRVPVDVIDKDGESTSASLTLQASEDHAMDAVDVTFDVALRRTDNVMVDRGLLKRAIEHVDLEWLAVRAAAATVQPDDAGIKLIDAAREVLADHQLTDLEDGGSVAVDAAALADLRSALRVLA